VPVIIDSFNAFIEAVDNDHPEPQAVDDPCSSIGKAYYTFWKAVGDAGTLIV
jgi:hypothetical protein